MYCTIPHIHNDATFAVFVCVSFYDVFLDERRRPTKFVICDSLCWVGHFVCDLWQHRQYFLWITNTNQGMRLLQYLDSARQNKDSERQMETASTHEITHWGKKGEKWKYEWKWNGCYASVKPLLRLHFHQFTHRSSSLCCTPFFWKTQMCPKTYFSVFSGLQVST